MEKKLPKNSSRHGTLSGYTYYKCRCDKCKKNFSGYRAKLRKKYMKKSPEKDKLLKHGDASTYTNYGCHCDKCRAAKMKVQREYRKRIKK